MQLNSLVFLLFFAGAALVYDLLPGKFQIFALLVFNALFYASWTGGNGKAFLPLVFVILLTWGGAWVLSGKQRAGARWLFAVLVVLTLLPLLVFKYSNFLLENLDRARGAAFHPLSFAAPLGLSFFTFQALGYLIDVYRGKTSPERSLVRYAAYVSFFPTITAGPIGRSDGLLRQLQGDGKRRLRYENLRDGGILFLFGMFVKLVLAGRFAVVADTVFADDMRYGGAVLFLAAVFYTLQIYCDFASYSLLALGLAKMLGIQVIDNFRAPYFSESIREFWRRWHISLSTWFRDYVYIPLGGNRCSKARKWGNVLVTFLVSGLWHGADWTFLFWGGLHGVYQIAGDLTKPVRTAIVRKTGMDTETASTHIFRKAFTFLCVTFAWILFRSDGMHSTIRYIRRMVTEPRLWELTDGTLSGLGLDSLELTVLLIAFLVLYQADRVKYRTGENLDAVLGRQNAWFRILVVLSLILATLIFGEYGPQFSAQAFIYMQF
jgi:alginate O-acetyltransferase complex protein AlgI